MERGKDPAQLTELCPRYWPPDRIVRPWCVEPSGKTTSRRAQQKSPAGAASGAKVRELLEVQ
jgi:hypothetical protein